MGLDLLRGDMRSFLLGEEHANGLVKEETHKWSF
jgi:hypothetical protein